MLQVPEKAIGYFEEVTNTRLTLYIHSPIFSMATKYRIHAFAPCHAAKQKDERTCIHFETQHVCQSSWKYRDGGVKICHMGILEWFVPIFSNNKLACLITAGIRRPPKKIPDEIAVMRTGEPSVCADLSEVPETNSEELLRVMELLRMLAARLTLWHTEMQNSDFAESDMTRGDVIRCIIGRECTRGLTLEKLSSHLHLSPSRTAHIVKEETGESFTSLLVRNRLEFAANLLRHSDIPVSGVAERCGFGDTANFHRLFRREFNTSPLEFRKNEF